MTTVLGLGSAVAQEGAASTPANPTDPRAPQGGERGIFGLPKAELPPFNNVVKDMTANEGLFTVHSDAKNLRGFLEIPSARLNRPFLLATSLAGGTRLTGWQWSNDLVYWKEQNNVLMLVRKNASFRAKKDSPLASSVERTYTDELVLAVPVATKSPKGGLIIGLDELFAKGANKFFGRGAQLLDPMLASFPKLKVFPNNIEIAVEMPPREGGPFVTLHYSLRDLGNSSYKPRAADPRIGYFLTVAKDFSDGPYNDGRFLRLINRWHLEKLDPKLELSPVKEPIVFYLEKTIPIAYRRYVAEGVLEWNKAFQKVGYLDAVQVRQQTDSNEFKDFDPEDARYNFIRWITSDEAYAMGPSRTNPMTGEILDADIVFDDAMVNWSISDYDRFFVVAGASPSKAQRALASLPAGDRALASRLPDLSNGERLSGFDVAVLGELKLRPRKELDHICHFGVHKRHELAMSAIRMGQPGTALPLEFIGQFIKETVMHEVGHTLGLRHNFIGSTNQSLATINSADKPAVTTGSVMDYNPINVALDDKSQGRYQTDSLGPYDLWAIEYGYSSKDDEKSLEEIATKCAKEGHAYATDEDVFGPDPYVNRWDLGADPLEFSQQRIAIAKKFAEDLEKRVMTKGRSYRWLRWAFAMLLFEYDNSAWFASRFLGGVRVHKHHFGDEGGKDPLEPIPAAQQRKALRFILDEILSAESLNFRPELLRRLGPNPWDHWGSEGGASDFPVAERILEIQSGALDMLMSSRVLDSILETERKLTSADDLLTLPELFESILASVTSEFDARPQVPATNRSPFISAARRNLQRALAQSLIEKALAVDSWASAVGRNLAWRTLDGYSSRIKACIEANLAQLDPYSLAHLQEMDVRITKAREAAYQLGGESGGGMGGLMFLFGRDGQRYRLESTPEGFRLVDQSAGARSGR